MINQAAFEELPIKLKWRNWVILGLLVLFSGVCLPWRFTMGVSIGGMLANINFHLLHRVLVKMLIVDKTSKGIVFKNLFRLFISAIIIAIFLKQNWVDVIGLFLGLSVVIINLFILTLEELKALVFK